LGLEVVKPVPSLFTLRVSDVGEGGVLEGLSGVGVERATIKIVAKGRKKQKGGEVRPSEERNDKLTTPLQAAKTTRAGTSIQDTPPRQPTQ